MPLQRLLKVEIVILHEAVVHLVGMNHKIYFCTVSRYSHFVITYKIFELHSKFALQLMTARKQA